MLWLGILVFMLSLSVVTVGHAQNDEDTDTLFMKFKDTFDGYLKNATAVRANELDRFVKIENSFELGYSKRLTDMFGITLKGLAVYDAVYDVEEDLHVEDEEEYRAYIALREAFVDLTFDKLDLRLGKQQVVWGKTDGFRVLDTVNPLDYKEFVLSDFLDARIPLWMGKVEYYFNTDFSLQALVIPEMQFFELAKTGSEYELNTLSIPEGIHAVINDTKEPDESMKNTEYGIKFTGFYAGWDFTLNYLYSWDDIPVIKKSLDRETGTLTVSPEHERLHIVGGSFANVFWDAVVRGELAAKIGQYFSVDDPTVSDMVVEKTQLSYALAFERDLFDVSWLLQILQETILDYDSAITDDEIDTKITLRGTKNFMNETLEVVVSTIYGVNETEFLIRPSIEYDITDSTKIKVGADFFEGGDNDTMFGQFNEKDRLYVELKYSF
ncbi:hypothetical protein U27_03025 [Candidatus Vecturithrix granuli]|uniref:Uncharacterized protein n=1 Tax=Vecturithrix granuli TaxID=1499967 RepID=A0A081BUQ8_VECG1|nr:hypothetical protein U27_03025 [Candidatus Vecturithrix granuli]